ncbi:MAG: non-ribosomal peptide synthetase, partial [Nocardioidaceae bacterium]
GEAPGDDRTPGSVGRAVGCEVRVVGPDGEAVPASHEGEIYVRGPQVCGGYCDSGVGAVEPFAGGWLRTGDIGHLDARGDLWLTGRAAEVINRAGAKIVPGEWEGRIRTIDVVEDVAVFGFSEEGVGELVGCAVVVPDVADESLPERLAELGVAPDRLLVLASIPTTQIGKVDRQQLAALAVTPFPETVEAVPTLDEVARLWRSVQPGCGADEHFLDAGGASLQGMRIERLVARTFGVDVPPGSILGEGATIRSMAHLVDTLQKETL